MKADGKTVKSVNNILLKFDDGPYVTKYQIRKLISQIGVADTKRVLLLGKSDLTVYNMIIEAGDCTSLQDLQIDGNDLIKAGISEEGRQIRRILDELLEDVMKNPDHNFSNYLMEKAMEISPKYK